ncbi:uncharacterized protein LOC105195111 isoform X1 [Solenopsis invicta]|uniref:uncharacterized protein LOC105195111 isoform X1 n=2 Tax=Solenopsis invicta TaxID=13686 RepID=UPI000595F5E6|nr:uncharacterized protein LOC105195111 isoform X1 [Solenopsis invicta]XP_039305840.1 uncharacterized protein LOC105195111 isoform X1 [Solenopsis invicta]
MQVTMLVPAIRRSVPCNLRRVAACVIYRNKTRTRIVRRCDESNFLFTSLPNVVACRTYNTESDSESHASLPMLVTGADVFTPSLLTPFRLFFLSFRTIPYIDKEFLISETLNGAKYAITVISKALANRDYDSLEGLVAENMIEVLRTKIETLNPEQRCLIAVNQEDIAFHVLCDIAATTDKEHSIEFKMICHYIPGMTEKKQMLERANFTDLSKLGNLLVCNYTFTRKYVNNIGGSWIATFVNHFSINLST